MNFASGHREKKVVFCLREYETKTVQHIFRILTLSLMVTFPFAQAVAAPLTCQQLPAILVAFERQHYSHPRLDGALQARTTTQFVKALDPTKTALLQSEVDQIKQQTLDAFESMRKGDCRPIEAAYQKLVTRAEQDYTFARTLLGAQYKLDETVSLVIDPDQRSYPKTEEERTARLRDFMHFQMSNYLLAGLTLEKARTQLVHRYELAVKRLKDRQAKFGYVSLMAESFAEALDPHSSYMSQDTLANFQIDMSLSLEGIGAALSSQDGFTVVETLVPGGQAEKSGQLRPKDKIIAVMQQGQEPVSTIDLELDQVVKMIRGKKGTTVTLTVLREAGDKPKTFQLAIVRDKVDVSSQAAKIEYKTRKVGDKAYTVGVIDLPSFYGGQESGRWSHKDVQRLLEEAKKKPVDAIVLDLSRNGGGLLDEAVRISGLFIRRGGVVGTLDSDKQMNVLDDTDDSVIYNGPLVLLTSSVSASASEILAGAMQDYKRAVIVGSTQTFGKGTIQQVMPLPLDLGAIKVTVGMFFLPGGKSTQQKGVPADVQIPTLYDGIELSEAKMDNSLPPQAIAPFVSRDANGLGGAHFTPVSEALVQSLQQKSIARRATEPGFQKVKAKIEELKDKKPIKLAELRQKNKDKGKNDDRDEVKELDAVVLNEAVAIAADTVALK